MVRCSLAMLLALGLFALGCVKKDEGTGTGKDGSAVTGDTSPGADVMPAPTTCQELRNCVFRCGQDPTCADRCVSSAPQAARGLYVQARMCSMQACPEQDIDCRCEQECHGGGSCTQVVDECDEAASDMFCDGPCH